jgi:hypothetical protein
MLATLEAVAEVSFDIAPAARFFIERLLILEADCMKQALDAVKHALLLHNSSRLSPRVNIWSQLSIIMSRTELRDSSTHAISGKLSTARLRRRLLALAQGGIGPDSSSLPKLDVSYFSLMASSTPTKEVLELISPCVKESLQIASS